MILILRLLRSELFLYKLQPVPIGSHFVRSIVVNIDVAAVVDRVRAFELFILVWNLLLCGTGLAATHTHNTFCLHLFKHTPLGL